MKIEQFGHIWVSDKKELIIEKFNFVDVDTVPTPRDVMICIINYMMECSGVTAAELTNPSPNNVFIHAPVSDIKH